MNVYLDDNFVEQTLAGRLRKTGRQVVRPADAGLSGAADAQHLEYAIRHQLVVLTQDRDDFRDLHQLLETAGGHHFGILLVAFENNKAKDMKTHHVVAAVGKLEQFGAPVADQLILLNQWR